MNAPWYLKKDVCGSEEWLRFESVIAAEHGWCTEAFRDLKTV